MSIDTSDRPDARTRREEMERILTSPDPHAAVKAVGKLYAEQVGAAADQAIIEAIMAYDPKEERT